MKKLSKTLVSIGLLAGTLTIICIVCFIWVEQLGTRQLLGKIGCTSMLVGFLSVFTGLILEGKVIRDNMKKDLEEYRNTLNR